MNKVIFGPQGIAVVDGAVCKCSFGSAPNKLSHGLNSTMDLAGKKVLTIDDARVSLNIPTSAFGLCNGIPPTPSIPKPPCDVMIIGSWVGEPSAIKVNGVSILTDKHQILCNNARVTGVGTITIENTGQ
ncbi:MAG: DUF4280 domain-containing protein [Oscillospiraceae bacterium]|nr:DUF4280 domain-containing protein [Oscillospiraceae bacterium]